MSYENAVSNHDGRTIQCLKISEVGCLYKKMDYSNVINKLINKQYIQPQSALLTYL